MNIKDIFLSNLKDMIADKGMSFRAFSLDIGINRRTMNRWFYDRSPRPESVIRIADYFNCSVDYLLDKTDSPKYMPSKNKESFYLRYTSLRERNKFTDRYVAQVCKIRPSAVTNWKHGAIPSLEVTASLCDLFYCSFDYLVGRSDS